MLHAVGSILVGLTLILGQWLPRGAGKSFVSRPHELPPAEFYRALASGQLLTWVDALWIQALQDPEYAPVAPGQKSSNSPWIERIAELDPGNLANYSYAGIVLGVTRRDSETAVPVLLRGDAYLQAQRPEERARWKDPWIVPYLLGWLLLFDRQDLGEGSQALLRAAQLPGAPEFIVSYSQGAKTLEGTYNMGLRTLTSMIRAARTPEEKKALETRKKRLFVTSYVHGIEERFRNFLKAQGIGAELASSWRRFLRSERLSTVDPWGGVLSLDRQGRVQTTTPFDRGFSLKF